MKKLLLTLMSIFFVFATTAYAQRTIGGKVTSSGDGLSLPGVSVVVKGTSTGTQTDIDGNYSITVPANAQTLVFSYLGFITREENIGNRTIINIALAPDQKQLSEVVVVGYGTQIKQDLTGSITGVKARQIENLPLPSFESALQGRAAGVFINSGSGKLGQALNIRIRGTSSISASSQPLFVIDGIPIIVRSLGSATEPDNPLADINPEDIESIDVLKDASAAAIYGSRASNGVILITTKSGKIGKTKVNFGFFGGTSNPTRKNEFLNAAEYRELFSEAANRSFFNGLFWNFNDPEDAFIAFSGDTESWSSNFDTDWANQAFQNGNAFQYNFSVSGGDAKTRFFVSGTKNDQKGIINGNELNRISGRINIDHNIYNNLKIGANVSLSKSDNFRVPSDNAFSNPLQLNALPPIQPLFDQTTGKLNNQTLYYNNLIDQVNGKDISSNLRSISVFSSEWGITNSLVARAEYGFEVVNLEEEQFRGRETLDGAPTGQAFNRQVRSLNNNFNSTLNFSKDFGKSSLQLLGGFAFQESNIKSATSFAEGLPNDKFTKAASGAVTLRSPSDETGSAIVSYFARANYKFNNKYLLAASARVDGSSRFGIDNRYGLFPSASAGWILSEESFLANNKTISFLKLRASYGTTGNDDIGNFSSRTLFGAGFYADQAGIVPTSIGNRSLRWERTNQLDVGLDFGFFNNRVNGEIDYYLKTTNDILLREQVPGINGFTQITRNIGSMENKGFEFVINSDNLVGKFKWSTSFNIAFNKNKVTRLDNNGTPILGGARQLGSIQVGQPFGVFFGRKYAGVDPANGDALFLDANGNTTNDFLAANDRIVGDPNPDFYGGMNNTFSYKNFDLDVQLQFVYGNDLYNIAGFFQSVNGDFYDNQTKDQLKFWRNPGDITNIPEPRLLEGNGAEKSSRWVQDGSYLRVKAVNFSYNIPATFLNRYKIGSARVFMTASNLFTFTKYTGYDPEINTTFAGGVNLGHDFYTPPQAKTITFGVNFGF